MNEEVGRPIEMSSRNRGMNFSVYVDPNIMDVLEEIRWREHKSMSAIIRKAMEEYVKIHASGNDTYKLDEWENDPSFQATPAYYSAKDKWVNHYRASNNKDRTNLRVQNLNMTKWFRMVDTNGSRS